MREDLEARVADHLDGTLDAPAAESLARELEKDSQALTEYADQLEIHHRLKVALEQDKPGFAEAVVREIRLMPDAQRFSEGVVREIKRSTRSLRVREWAAAAVILVAVGLALLLRKTDPMPAASNAPDVLLVVGRLPLEPGDLRVKERLEHLGCRVSAQTALQVVPADAAGRALVAISSTTLAADMLDVPGELTAKFRDAGAPVLTWEPRLFYDLGMIAGSTYQKDWGAARGQTRLVVRTDGHPLAAGLSGAVEVLSTPGHLSWGRTRADAIRIATLESDPTLATIFAYDAGAAMPGLLAPSRRVGLFLFDTTSLQLTPQGWQLFDAAVRWSLKN
ncbi:MAG TPA: hypothetical protein VNM14_16910 [Planctomycetota bacterium]|nr:hypothetical protein [Planctomycetota bacterium]